MHRIADSRDMQQAACRWRAEGKIIGLVPTMGFLHDGHLSLMRIAREQADVVITSVFVNPTQFGENEDFGAYPRNLERDAALCEAEGVHVLFSPCAESMYRRDASVTIHEDRLSNDLCGASRPGHFSGVLTVVTKLFNLTQCQIAVFGEKDAQQLRLIQRLVRDLNLPVTIVPGPIVREADGLAMSSRNANLSSGSRQQAPVLRQTLTALQDLVALGENDVGKLRDKACTMLAAAPLGALDYLSFVDNETLEPLSEIDRETLCAIAVQFPEARLIDNIVLTP